MLEELRISRANYRGSIRWYMELLRYKQSLDRTDDFSVQGKMLRQDADAALIEAAHGILNARTSVTNIQLKLGMGKQDE